MKRKDSLEGFATSINNMDDNLPKSRGRCFDIGTWGGCGCECPAFLDGECKEPQEIIDKSSPKDVIDYLKEEGYYSELINRINE